MCLKIHFFCLLLTWLNRGVNSRYLSRQRQREKTVVIVREGSRRVLTVHFLWSEASFWVPWAMKRWKQLEWLQRRDWPGKTTTIAWRKGVGSHKRTHSKWKHGRQDSWDKGVEGKEEIRVSRNGRRLVLTEEKRNPLKSGVVWILFSLYVAPSNSPKRFLRQVPHRDFLCSEIVLNLNFCFIPQMVHCKLFRYNNIITTKTYKFWILIRNKQTRENCIPHGSRIMGLDVLRSSLKCCQHCKGGEKKQFFWPNKINTKEKSKWIISFMASTQIWGYKINRFPKK